MSKRPVLIGAGIAAVGALALAGPAVAADYPPVPILGLITLSTTTPTAGVSFTATLADGSCDPGSSVNTTANGFDKGTGTANGSGGYTKNLTIYDPGKYTIVMSCTKAGTAVAYSADANVQSSGGGNDGGGNSNDLASTGADNTLTIAAIGGGLILVGGGAVYASRRRERSAR